MKKKNQNSKMTLEKLAGMVARGFDKTATKEDLDKLDSKMNSRLSELEGKLEAYTSF